MSAKFTTTYIANSLAKHIADRKLPRERFTDKDCKNLQVSITASGAVFNLRFTDKVKGKQVPVQIGLFDKKTFNVDHARIKAMTLKSQVGVGVDIVARARTVLNQKRSAGKTFNEVADLYIDHMRVEEDKEYGTFARRESWVRLGGPEKVGAAVRYPGGYLKRARAEFGHKAIADVDDNDCALLLNHLVDVLKLRGLASNLRTTLFGLFAWACQPGSDVENGTKFVSVNPCANLRKRPKRIARKRAFKDHEIVAFWTGCDAIDRPMPRAVALGYKLMLCSGLRGGEVSSIQREWLDRLPDGTRVVRFPAWAVKQRRKNTHPLNALACEVIDELLAMSDATTGPLFPPGPNGAAFKRHMLTDYLTDRGYNAFAPKDGVVRRHGFRSYLGFEKDWRPHDLRHTVASLIVRNGMKLSDVTKLLDHSPSANDDDVAKITEDYTNLEGNESAMLKLPIVTEIDRLLRGILGLTPPVAPATDVASLMRQIAELQAQVTAATAGKVASIQRAA